MKLFSIGDSITQGFMSFAAAKTNLAYPSLLAKALGIESFKVCDQWPHGGIPLNLEETLRRLEKLAGNNIWGLEWVRAVSSMNNYIDACEDYYERGDGAPGKAHASGHEYHHNVASFGMTIADIWLLDCKKCQKYITDDTADNEDNLFGLASQPFLRSLNTVLNPSQNPEHEEKTVLDWLESHVMGQTDGEEAGVENLTIWLGNNNVLGTVLRLKPKQTQQVNDLLPHQLQWKERCDQGWDLWHPDHFKAEYAEMLKLVDQIMRKNPDDMDWRVFVGTVPHVTIVPLVRGFGEVTRYPGTITDQDGNPMQASYYKYYTYFFLRDEDAQGSKWPKLSMQVARYIDEAINQYNKHIANLLDHYNKKHGKERYFLVDTNRALAEMAWKRNDGKPFYDFPNALDWLFPPISTRYYHCSPEGDFIKGGIFSLDGVHPTAIGHGIVAHEFLKVMQSAGVTDTQGAVTAPASLSWNEIIGSDTLYRKPIKLMHEIYQHSETINLIKGLCGVS